MTYYVYSHIQVDTGQIFYIGKGHGNRAYSKVCRSKLWKNVANKHGWKAVIICDDLTEEEAFEVEKFYIKEYGRRDLGTGNLVNFTDGGEGTSGRPTSYETRKKLSDANKGQKRSEETCLRMSETHKGRKRSEEHRKKISESKKGRIRKPFSDEHRKKLSDAWKGRVVSNETRKKMSETSLLRGKRVFTEEWKKNIALARLNKKQLAETRKKISDTLKEFHKNQKPCQN